MNNREYTMPLIDKWERSGYLTNISEENKKYLSDLFEALYDENTNIHEIRYENKSLLYPILKKCYEMDNTICFNEFSNAMNNVDVFSNMNNNALLSEDELVDITAAQVNEYVKSVR